MEANPLFDNKLILAHISCEIELKKNPTEVLR